ncbi:hypothetical protein GCK72_008480 [Caenorhabditis remanei]|uniref:Uncharacterized protein n=1 Tax=Caenorhabditis remanei TaxID=31234 RepID=A0A6A5H0D8_CAERE|nr:hypothetical protein GCK72_008480 [Caenorhabditis remanei]KAF1760234.1 hypothetical protein GCK72_008480 [Caenorhabditis remanei]
MLSELLIICLFFATRVHAGALASHISTTATPKNFDNKTALFIDEELTKISTTCLSGKDHEEITGNILKDEMARTFNIFLGFEAVYVIGLTELRSVLGFSPSVPCKNFKTMSLGELEVATIEEYYEVKEPISWRHEEYGWKLEKNLPPAISFLDNRFPAIRTAFRKHLEEQIGRLEGKIDRAAVDYMIKQYYVIYSLVLEKTRGLWGETEECKTKRPKKNSCRGKNTW